MRGFKNTWAQDEANAKNNEVRSTVGLRAKDINAFQVVLEFLNALKEGRTQVALDISQANPDLKPYFNWCVKEYAIKEGNAALA